MVACIVHALPATDQALLLLEGILTSNAVCCMEDIPLQPTLLCRGMTHGQDFPDACAH